MSKAAPNSRNEIDQNTHVQCPVGRGCTEPKKAHTTIKQSGWQRTAKTEHKKPRKQETTCGNVQQSDVTPHEPNTRNKKARQSNVQGHVNSAIRKKNTKLTGNVTSCEIPRQDCKMPIPTDATCALGHVPSTRVLRDLASPEWRTQQRSAEQLESLPDCRSSD